MKTEVFGVRADTKLAKAIRDGAATESRPISQFLRLLIEKALKVKR